MVNAATEERGGADHRRNRGDLRAGGRKSVSLCRELGWGVADYRERRGRCWIQKKEEVYNTVAEKE